MLNLKALVTAALLFGISVAHPGETHTADEIKQIIAARDLGILHSKRVVDKCASSPNHAALRARAAARRSMTAQVLREQRGIVHSKRPQTTPNLPVTHIHVQNAWNPNVTNHT